MSRRLVVNADDLGLHPEIDAGILEANANGIVTSTSVLVMGPSAESAVRKAREQQLGLGVHLCLSTRLAPAAGADQVPSLLEEDRFPASWLQVAKRYAMGRIRLPEVEREFRAQIARLRELGAEPDHLDSHQHLHLLPGVAEVVASIARELGVPVRWPSERPARSWSQRPGPALKSLILGSLAFSPEWRGVRRVRARGLFEAGSLSEERLVELIRTLPEGDSEIGCHPGAKTVRVPEDPEWAYGWETELRALCSHRVRQEITRQGVELVRYDALR